MQILTKAKIHLLTGEKTAPFYLIKEEGSPKSYNLKNFQAILIFKSDGRKNRGDRSVNTQLRKINADKESKPIWISRKAMKTINKWVMIKNKKFVRCF